MNSCLVHGAGLSLLCLCTVGAGREVRDAAKKPIPAHAQVQKWIGELGDDSFEVREAATRNLIESWQQSLPAVADAVKSMDAEVRNRAGHIIKQIDTNAAARLEAFGAVLNYDNDRFVSCVSFGSGADKEKARHLVDKDLVHLLALPKIETINLDGTKVGDAGLQHLGKVRTLRYLCLDHTRITDDGLAHLVGLRNLKTLMMQFTNLTGRGLVHLKKLVNLEDLALFGSPIDDAGLAVGVVGLLELKQLRELSLSHTQLTDNGIVTLKALSLVNRLDLRKTPITNKAIGHLRSLRCLERLDVKETAITDEAIVHLLEMKNLTVICLGKTLVTPKGLKQLKALPKLKCIEYRGSRLTEVQENALEKELIGVEILLH